MHTKKSLLALLLAALSLGNVVASSIVDSFDNGLANWTISSGTWNTLPDQTLFGAWSYSDAYSSQGVLRLNNVNQPVGDFTASIDFTRVSNAGYYVPGADPSYAAAATFGFIQTDGRRLDIGVQGLGSVANTLSTPQTSIFAVAQIYNGPGPYSQPLGSTVNIDWDPNVWNTLGLSRVGSVYSISLNGTLLTTFTDTNFNGAGDLSLKTYGASHFDNFTLSQPTDQSVPDGGGTLVLMGVSFISLAIARRFRR